VTQSVQHRAVEQVPDEDVAVLAATEHGAVVQAEGAADAVGRVLVLWVGGLVVSEVRKKGGGGMKGRCTSGAL